MQALLQLQWKEKQTFFQSVELKLLRVCILYAGTNGGAVFVNIRIPWWWHSGSAETCGKEIVRRLCLMFIAWIVGYVGWMDVMHSA